MGETNKPVRPCFISARLDDAGLSWAAFRIYCHLARRAGTKGQAYPSIREIKRTCGGRRETIITALRELEERGMIMANRKWGVTSTYKLTDPLTWKGLTDPQNSVSPHTGLVHEPDRTSLRSGPDQSTALHADQPSKPICAKQGNPRRYSKKVGQTNTPESTPAPDSAPSKTQKTTKLGQAPSLSEITEYCADLDLPASDAEYCDGHWEGNGFTNNGRPITSWKGVIRSWKAAGHLPSQKAAAAGKTQKKYRP